MNTPLPSFCWCLLVLLAAFVSGLFVGYAGVCLADGMRWVWRRWGRKTVVVLTLAVWVTAATGAGAAEISKEDLRKTVEHIQRLARDEEQQLATARAQNGTLQHELTEAQEEEASARVALEAIRKQADALAKQAQEDRVARDAARTALRAATAERARLVDRLVKVGAALAVVAAWVAYLLVAQLCEVLPVPWKWYVALGVPGLVGAVAFALVRWVI